MRRSLLLLVPLAATAAGLGACGGSSDKSSSKSSVATNDPVVHAVRASFTQGGGIRMQLKGTVSTAGQTIPIAGSGVIDSKRALGNLVFTTKVPGAGAVTAREVFTGDTIYLNLGSLSAGRLPGGKHWMSINLKKSIGLDLSKLGGTDPRQFLDYLQGADHSQKVGTETIDGRRTTHYRATVDLGASARNLPAPARKALDSLSKDAKLKALPIDAWVDDQGLLRREHVSYRVEAGPAGPIATDVTVDLLDFGAKATAKAPPASDVFDISAIASQLGGQTQTTH